METESSSHVTQIDQSGDCKVVMSFPGDHVQLWPLSEYLGTLAEWQFGVTGLYMSALRTEGCEALVDYLTYYTPVNPSDRTLLKTVTEENKKVRTC